MPREVVRVSKGKYKVRDVKPMANGRYRYFSKEGMSKQAAQKQLTAINLSELRRSGKKI